MSKYVPFYQITKGGWFESVSSAENREISLDKARGRDAEPYNTVDALSQAEKLTEYLYGH